MYVALPRRGRAENTSSNLHKRGQLNVRVVLNCGAPRYIYCVLSRNFLKISATLALVRLNTAQTCREYQYIMRVLPIELPSLAGRLVDLEPFLLRTLGLGHCPWPLATRKSIRCSRIARQSRLSLQIMNTQSSPIRRSSLQSSILPTPNHLASPPARTLITRNLPSRFHLRHHIPREL